MKVSDILNRLKDTRGFINEQEVNDWEEDDMAFMLEGIEGAIQFFEEWLNENEDLED